MKDESNQINLSTGVSESDDRECGSADDKSSKSENTSTLSQDSQSNASN